MYVTKCAYCAKEIKLLKDSTDGMKVYCGDCYEQDKKKGKEIYSYLVDIVTGKKK